jgi:hypothetical protein
MKLIEISTEFDREYERYSNGKNAKVRASGKKQVYFLINGARWIIEGHDEIRKLMATTEYGTVHRYSEFFEPNYFGKDMQGLLGLLVMKISELN